MTVPARSWKSRNHPTLDIEHTGPADTHVELWTGVDGSDGPSVVLDIAQTKELVCDLLRRLAVMAGRQAAVEAAASASVAALSGPEDKPSADCGIHGSDLVYERPGEPL